jgi:hypothetical protein
LPCKYLGLPLSLGKLRREDEQKLIGKFQAALVSLPCKYLGLPLSLGKLCREDGQKLTAKVAAKLPRWKGRLLNKSRRLTLVISVLSSVVVYHMTMFSPLK